MEKTQCLSILKEKEQNYNLITFCIENDTLLQVKPVRDTLKDLYDRYDITSTDKTYCNLALAM